jgi:predicted nucleic acid-binding protein
MYLIDTNVLLRSVDTAHPMNGLARSSIRDLRSGGTRLFVVPQILYEF